MHVRTPSRKSPTTATPFALATVATLATLPGLALAHTGTDAGSHHTLVDALLYSLADLSLPALVVALGVWGAIFMASRAAKKRKQEIGRSGAQRDRT